MSKKKSLSKTFILFSLFCGLLYLFLFPYRIVPQAVVRTERTIHVPDPAVGETVPAVFSGDRESATPFFLESEHGGVFGFIDDGQRLLYYGNSESGLTVSPYGFITYPQVPSGLVRKDIYGQTPLSISGPGYPLFKADGSRLFIITSDCTSLREVNKQGVTLWRRSVPSWMTSFSATEDLVLLGLSSGQFMLLGKNGETVSGGRINDSRILCIYGTAIQQGGKCFAVLSGVDPMFLVVYETGNFSEIMRFEVHDSLRSEHRMLFSPDLRFLFFETDESVSCLDLETREITSINLPGHLTDLYYHEAEQLLHILCSSGESRELLVVHPPDTVVFRTRFSSATQYLGSDGKSLFAGRNADIVPYTVEEE